MPRRWAATLPPFRKRHPHAQFSFLSWWRRWCGGSARSRRNSSRFIGVTCFIGRKVPIDPSRLILRRIKRVIVCGRIWCFPAFKGAHIHWGRRNWRRIRLIRWLRALFFVLSHYCHSSQQVERVVRQVEVIEVGWDNWVLITKPVRKCGFVRVWVYRDNLWLRRGDGGDCDWLSFHTSW